MIGQAAALAVASLLFSVPSTDATSAYVGCKEKNAYLNNIGALEVTQSTSSDECFRLCTKNPSCSSVNYNELNRSCVLGSRAILIEWSTVHMVAAPGFTHISLYSCSPEIFWSQCDFQDCGKHRFFRKHGNMCFFIYTMFRGDLFSMATRCRALGGEPAKLRSQASADDMRAWIGELKGLGIVNAFLGAQYTGQCNTFTWMVDGSPVTLWRPFSAPSRCYGGLTISEKHFSTQWMSNPRPLICERLC